MIFPHLTLTSIIKNNVKPKTMEDLKELRAMLKGRIETCNKFLNDPRNKELYSSVYRYTEGEVNGYKVTLSLVETRITQAESRERINDTAEPLYIPAGNRAWQSKYSKNNNQTAYRNNLNNLDETNR